MLLRALSPGPPTQEREWGHTSTLCCQVRNQGSQSFRDLPRSHQVMAEPGLALLRLMLLWVSPPELFDSPV